MSLTRTIKLKLWLLNKLGKWLNADQCLTELEAEKKRSNTWADTAKQYAMNADYWRSEVEMRDRHKAARVGELEGGLRAMRNQIALYRDNGIAVHLDDADEVARLLLVKS